MEKSLVLSGAGLIGAEVMTETGDLLGWVRLFRDAPESDSPLKRLRQCLSTPVLSEDYPDNFEQAQLKAALHNTRIVIAASRWKFLSSKLISTYELCGQEVFATGPSRLLVREGAETRLRSLTVGIFEQFGFCKPLWLQDCETDSYISPISTALGTWRGFDDDDAIGGVAPTPRPRNPTPKPIIDSSTASPD